MNRHQCWMVVCLLAVALVPNLAFAQAGVSSLSMGMSRAGILPSFENIRIEEYINYHRNELRLPADDERVALDLRWSKSAEKRAVLQVGLATPRALDPELVPPLNLVLVIDRSGSMSGDRIANVKKAICAFIERLRPYDLVTIVSFNESARVDLSACQKTSQKKINRAIDRLQAGGSTNLHAGLMLGYAEAKQNYDAERTNRVILLSDGIANVGVTDSVQIAHQSKKVNRQGIDLSTIGLGYNFNQQLLRQLADAGRGLIHFVGDSNDIEKTFIREVDSLLAPAAKKVRLLIDLGPEHAAAKVFGYAPQQTSSRYTFKLDDLNHGATQVVLIEVKNPSSSPVKVTLQYVDALTSQATVQRQTTCWSRQEHARDTLLADPDLRKNFAIAMIADSIKQSLKFAEASNFDKAEQRIKKGIKFAKQFFDTSDDSDVARMVKIAKDYRKTILACRHVSK